MHASSTDTRSYVTLIVTKKRMNCFAGNSAILPSSCYEVKPLFTNHYRFWSQQHVFRRKSVFTRQIRRSCLQITFSRNAETIIANAGPVKQLI